MDDKFNYICHLANHGHADFAINTEGNQVYVSFFPAKYEILKTGELIDLLGETYACGHLNLNYQNVLDSTGNVNEDFVVLLDTTALKVYPDMALVANPTPWE